MCRGCIIKRNGKPTVFEYLDWLDDYKQMTVKMKVLEQDLLRYQEHIDGRDHRDILDTFRKKLITLRREYANADQILNTITKE